MTQVKQEVMANEKIRSVICPFCKSKHSVIKGDGCCYCEYTGMVAVGEDCKFKTAEDAENHDPEVSLVDRQLNIDAGKDPNFKPWQ